MKLCEDVCRLLEYVSMQLFVTSYIILTFVTCQVYV